MTIIPYHRFGTTPPFTRSTAPSLDSTSSTSLRRLDSMIPMGWDEGKNGDCFKQHSQVNRVYIQVKARFFSDCFFVFFFSGQFWNSHGFGVKKRHDVEEEWWFAPQKCSSRRDSHGGETSAGRTIQRKKCRLPRNFSWRTIRHPNPPKIAVQIGGFSWDILMRKLL